METEKFLTEIFRFLNDNAEYAVLRNFEGLPERNNSRDIDIAIEKKTFKRIRRPLVNLIDSLGWKIITYLKSDRLITWVCAHLDNSGHAELVQLDFFYHTSLFGVVLIENKDILERRIFSGKLWHADKDFEFLDKYVYDRAVGAQYPEKYRATRDAAEFSPVVQAHLEKVFGVNSVDKCDKAGKKLLLKNALKFNFKRYGAGTLFNLLRFEFYRLRNYLKSDTGFSIGFTGPDGAGKTTVIDGMIAEFGDVFRKAHVYHHFRPMMFGNLGDVAHSAGLKKEVDHNYDKPHRGGKTSTLSSLARLAYYSVDYIVGFWTRVKNHTRITKLVIFDRYFTDIICDSRRTRIYLNHKFLYRFGKLFIPSLDYNILLTAQTETILNRKRELEREGIEAINSKIDYLAPRRGYYKIMNEGTPEQAVAQILDTVFTAQHAKNMKRIGFTK